MASRFRQGMSRLNSRNVQGKAPPLRKLTALRKAFPEACYPLLCVAVAESRQAQLSLDETLAAFADRWSRLGSKNPPAALTASARTVRPPTTSQSAPAPRAGRWIRSTPTPSVSVLPAAPLEQLRNGMAVFRGLLPPEMQQWLADLFFAVGDSGEREGFGCFSRAPGGRLVLNYGHRAQYVDEVVAFPALFQELHRALRATVDSAEICGDAPATVAVVNFYGARSSGMGWHVDADSDPPHVSAEEAQGSAVVSLSIGDACDFCYRGGAGPAGEVRLESGDVLVFGGPSRSVEHCVAGINQGCRPKELRMPRGRINITFRYW